MLAPWKNSGLFLYREVEAPPYTTPLSTDRYGERDPFKMTDPIINNSPSSVVVMANEQKEKPEKKSSGFFAIQAQVQV